MVAQAGARWQATMMRIQQRLSRWLSTANLLGWLLWGAQAREGRDQGRVVTPACAAGCQDAKEGATGGRGNVAMVSEDLTMAKALLEDAEAVAHPPPPSPPATDASATHITVLGCRGGVAFASINRI